MQINNYSAPIFKGYKNVLANDLNENGFRLSYLAMQLDDSETKDLSEWKKIQELCPKKYSSVNDDVISLIYTKTPRDNDFLFLGENRLPFGDELAKDRENWVGTPFEGEYRKDEKIVLKSYTLFASLTRRLINNPCFDWNNQINKVELNFHHTLSTLLDGKPAKAQEIIDYGIKNGKPDWVAEFFNRGIQSTMKRFLK